MTTTHFLLVWFALIVGVAACVWWACRHSHDDKPPYNMTDLAQWKQDRLLQESELSESNVPPSCQPWDML